MLLTDFNHFKSNEAKLIRDKIKEDLSAAFFDPCFKDLHFLDQVCIYFFLRKLKYLDFIYLFILFKNSKDQSIGELCIEYQIPTVSSDVE